GHLAAMVGQMRHHAKGGRVGISLRHACSNADAAPEVLLAELSRAVSQPAAAYPAAPATATAPA
ncbi:MAG TPA: GGDEF domain-containing protein, partial [Duganella sp.]